MFTGTTRLSLSDCRVSVINHPAMIECFRPHQPHQIKANTPTTPLERRKDPLRCESQQTRFYNSVRWSTVKAITREGRRSQRKRGCGNARGRGCPSMKEIGGVEHYGVAKSQENQRTNVGLVSWVQREAFVVLHSMGHLKCTQGYSVQLCAWNRRGSEGIGRLEEGELLRICNLKFVFEVIMVWYGMNEGMCLLQQYAGWNGLRFNQDKW